MLTGMGWERLGAPALQPSSTHSLASHHSSAPGTRQPLPYHKPGKVIPPKRGGQRVSSSAMSSVSFTKHPQPLRQGSSGLCSAGLGAAGCLGSALAPAGWEQTPPASPSWGCASLTLARNSLLVFTGTLYIFHFSRLVFLANSCRVKLFNNIFGGMQAAGETQPKHFPCRGGFAT